MTPRKLLLALAELGFSADPNYDSAQLHLSADRDAFELALAWPGALRSAALVDDALGARVVETVEVRVGGLLVVASFARAPTLREAQVVFRRGVSVVGRCDVTGYLPC